MGIVVTKISWKHCEHDDVIKKSLTDLSKKYKFEQSDRLYMKSVFDQKDPEDWCTVSFMMGGTKLGWYTDVGTRARALIFQALTIIRAYKAECTFAGLGSLHYELDTPKDLDSPWEVIVDASKTYS